MMYLQWRDQFRLFLHSPPYGLLDWYEDLTSVNACIVTGAVYSRLLIYHSLGFALTFESIIIIINLILSWQLNICLQLCGLLILAQNHIWVILQKRPLFCPYLSEILQLKYTLGLHFFLYILKWNCYLNNYTFLSHQCGVIIFVLII